MLLSCLRALRRFDLTDQQRRVAEVIAEETIGRGTGMRRFPNQGCIAALAGADLTKSRISERLAELRSMEIIAIDGDEYRFQGDFSRWKKVGDKLVPLPVRIDGEQEVAARAAIAQANNEPVQRELWRNEFEDAMKSNDMEAMLRANAGALEGVSRDDIRSKILASLNSAEFQNPEPVPESGTCEFQNMELSAPKFQNLEPAEVPKYGTYSDESGGVPKIGTSPLKLKLKASDKKLLIVKGRVPESGTQVEARTLSILTENELIAEMREHLGSEEMHFNGGFYRKVMRNGLRDPEKKPMLDPLQTVRALRGALGEYRIAKTRTVITSKKAWLLDRARWIGLEMLRNAKQAAKTMKAILLMPLF